MAGDKFNPAHVFLSAFSISSIGGLAALLRSNKELTPRAVVSAFLYSGITGLIVALLWYNVFDGAGNIYFLLGVSGLAGIGGATVVDFLMQLFMTGRIRSLWNALMGGKIDINIMPPEEKHDQDDADSAEIDQHDVPGEPRE